MTYTFDELKALIEKRGVHPEFGEPGESFGIEQNSFELATFLTRMQELNVTSVLEIGTGYKGGLSRFLAHDMGWQVTSVDVEDYGHKFEGVLYVKEIPWIAGQVDLVFIDGNHNYENVKSDYETYARCAKKVIAFHDIAGWRDCEGVMWLWEELARENRSKSHAIIDEYETRAGIGWIEL